MAGGGTSGRAPFFVGFTPCNSGSGSSRGATYTMSVQPVPGQDQYTATATALVNNFYTKVTAKCQVEAAEILVCEIDDIIMDHCDATVGCENRANLRTIMCNPQQVVDAAVAAATETDIPAPVKKNVATLTAGFDPAPNVSRDAPPVAQQIAAYMNLRCAANLFSQQAITFPLLRLTDCTEAVVTGLNELDEQARCSMNALSELVPPDVIVGGGDGSATPIWKDPVHMTLLACGAFLIIVLGACAGTLINGTRASGTYGGAAGGRRRHW